MKLCEIICMHSVSRDFIERYDRDVPMLLFGAGGGCLPAIKMLEQFGVKILAVADNDERKWGNKIGRLSIVSLDEIMKTENNFSIFVSAPNNAHIIIPDLQKRVSGKKIYFFDDPNRICHEEYKAYLENNDADIQSLYDSLGDVLSKKTMENMLKAWVSGDFTFFEEIYVENQYFVSDIVTLKQSEVFLDIGAFTGDTIKGFLQASGKNYKKIIAIEPNPECWKELDELKTKVRALEVIHRGAYSRKGKFQFLKKEVGSMSQFILTESADGVEVDAVDNFIHEPVSFIKMDIEGLERDALKGTLKTIKNCRPRLAICVYHKYDDLLEIARFIMGLGLEYEIYLRHHSFYCGETVLYAV